MAFARRKFHVMHYNADFTVWSYSTTDAPAVFTAPGYFNEAWDMLRDGDLVVASWRDGEMLGGGTYAIAQVGKNVATVPSLSDGATTTRSTDRETAR